MEELLLVEELMYAIMQTPRAMFHYESCLINKFFLIFLFPNLVCSCRRSGAMLRLLLLSTALLLSVAVHTAQVTAETQQMDNEQSGK